MAYNGSVCIGYTANPPSCDESWADVLGMQYWIATLLRIPLCLPVFVAHMINTSRMVKYEGFYSLGVRKIFNFTFFLAAASCLLMLADQFNYRNTDAKYDSIGGVIKATTSSIGGCIMVHEGMSILSEISTLDQWYHRYQQTVKLICLGHIPLTLLWTVCMIVAPVADNMWFVSRAFFILNYGGIAYITFAIGSGCWFIAIRACHMSALSGAPIPSQSSSDVENDQLPPGTLWQWWVYFLRAEPKTAHVEIGHDVVDRTGSNMENWRFRSREIPWVRSLVRLSTACAVSLYIYTCINIYQVILKSKNEYLMDTPTSKRLWIDFLVRIPDPLVAAVALLYGYPKISGGSIVGSDFVILSPLGEGYYGVVMKGVLRRNQEGILVAIKRIKQNILAPTGESELLHEARMMMSVKHWNVLRSEGLSYAQGSLHMLVEFMELGDLQHFVAAAARRGQVLGLAQRLWYGLQIAQGMQAVARQGIVHRDLAARNCMITSASLGPLSMQEVRKLLLEHRGSNGSRRDFSSGESGVETPDNGTLEPPVRQNVGVTVTTSLPADLSHNREMEKPAVKMSKTAPLPSTDFEDYSCLHVVKVSDFGMARRVEGGLGGVYRESSAPRIPIRWTAPECVDGHVYSERSDVWAWAVTAWELFADGSPPFQDIPTRNVHAAVKAGCRPERPATCPPLVYDLLLKCWALEPNDRPVFSDIIDEVVRLFGQVCEGVKTAFPGNSQDQSHAELQRQATNESGRSVASGFPQVFVSQCDNYITDPSQIYIEAIEADGVMVGGMADKVLKVRKKSEKSSHDESYIDLKGEDMLEFRSTSEDC